MTHKLYKMFPLVGTILTVLWAGCAHIEPKEKPFVIEMRTNREPLEMNKIVSSTAQEPISPSIDSLVFLPTPRTVYFESGVYVPKDIKKESLVNSQVMPHDQGYRLSISFDGISIIANNHAGLYYAEQTLHQLKRQFQGTQKLPVTYIEDWPDFPNRGVMLDISRDKVPTMETLFQLVDMFAQLKINQLQLYMEHTFAYPGHEVVWRNASPLTPSEVCALDNYCKERFIELVPNQNSFGHMHRWLQHPEYQHLGETPSSPDLCPVHPGSIELLRSMYAALLPNFSSVQFNVGCDETFSLGKGCSREAVKQLGKGRVYLNFLTEIYALVREHGRTMQFWGDIILQYPELIPELPDHIIAMEWGYEASHPFSKRGEAFRTSGVPYYVCPGTSSWNSLLGRTDNSLANLRLAAQSGLDNGAIGYLITDWGDNGHWQFAPISFVPIAYGAAVSWYYDKNININLCHACDVHVFHDDAGLMTQAVMDLGSAHALTGCLRSNTTVYYGLLMHSLQGLPTKGFFNGLSLDGIHNAQRAIEDALWRIKLTNMQREDADLICDEIALNARMALLALRLGEARIAVNGGTSQVPYAIRSELAEEVKAIMAVYRELWLARNRPGGLSDSLARFQNLVDVLTRTS